MATNLFGTDGIRATVGTSIFTPHALPKIGDAIGQWIVKKYGPQSKVLLGHDTRISCHWVKAALQTGLLQHPIELYDAHVLPTPAILQQIQQNEFCSGIIISASHNPYHDNGIKLVDAKHGKISPADELLISALFTQSHSSDYQQFGTTMQSPQSAERYIKNSIENFDHAFLQGKKIVLDCANGATSLVAPAIFSACGANVIVINNQPDGYNINENCGALHLQQLQAAVVQHDADAGFAFDGDGDRVITVTREGIVKNGDDMLALLSAHPRYATQKTVIGTVMSNYGLEQHLLHQNKKLMRTAVGDKYIAAALETENGLLGGEQSGHLIMRDYLGSGDGIFSALRLLETIIHTDNWSMKSFDSYPQVLINIKVPHKKDLTHSPCAELIAESESELGSSGRILVRYSGTEPVLRIMTEAHDYTQAHTIAKKLSEKLLTALS